MRTLLGHCPVDSGQIILVDPCYVDKGFDYGNVCDSHTIEKVGGPVTFSGAQPDGVVTSTGWGDGVYPVYAEIVDGRVMSVTIEFDTE